MRTESDEPFWKTVLRILFVAIKLVYIVAMIALLLEASAGADVTRFVYAGF